MKKYVLTFLFTPDFKKVWLIEKQKPEWQKGCINGIGGKIEDGEMPIEAAIRELKEEAGIDQKPEDITLLGTMKGDNNDGSGFEVFVFCGVAHCVLRTQEEEQIDLYHVDLIKSWHHIENVPMLVHASIYRLTGKSHFWQMEMVYNEQLKKK